MNIKKLLLIALITIMSSALVDISYGEEKFNYSVENPRMILVQKYIVNHAIHHFIWKDTKTGVEYLQVWVENHYTMTRLEKN